PGAGEGLIQHRADRGVVVGNEYGATGHGLPRARAGIRGGYAILHGQQDAEDGALWLAVDLDYSPVVVDDLGDEREPEPGAIGFCGDERIEQMLFQMLGDAGAIV